MEKQDHPSSFDECLNKIMWFVSLLRIRPTEVRKVPLIILVVASMSSLALFLLGLLVPCCASPVQLIDESGTFRRPAADAHLHDIGFLTRGLAYGVVAVVGPQSSGKSSLLNRVFGSDFSVMEASAMSARHWSPVIVPVGTEM